MPHHITPRQSSEIAAETLRLFYTNRTPATLETYRKGAEAFDVWYREKFPEAPEHALSALLGKPGDASAQGRAYGLALEYRGAMIAAGLSASTVNLRLAVLRAFAALARRLGLVAWTLEVPGVKARLSRDVRGPGSAAVAAMVAAVDDGAKGARDAAVLRLLHDVGLRRAEVASIDRAHVDRDSAGWFVSIRQKGAHDRATVRLPETTGEALAAWLVYRGDDDGPLFVNLDRGHGRGRLSGTSIYRLVREAGERVGAKARPHGLRHSGISKAARECGGDVLALREFARHGDIRTTFRYIDDATGRRDALAAAVARAVAAAPGPT